MASAKTKLILVRHGETAANREGRFAHSDDIPLNEEGNLQALRVAEQLAAGHSPQRIISSPFARARQTAAIIAERFGLPVETAVDLRERNFGMLRGRAYEQMGRLMLSDPAYDPAAHWFWAPQGGESLHDVQSRVVAAIETIAARYTGEEIVVVTHGAVMESVAAHLAGDWAKAAVPVNCGTVILEYPIITR